MGFRHDLKHSLLTIFRHNKDGSRSTQASRRNRLLLAINQLTDRGYQLRHVRQLKPKHVTYLVNHWLDQRLAAGTIKNRMADLRWLAEKLGLDSIIAGSNRTFCIPDRHYVAQQDKGGQLSDEMLNSINDLSVKLSLQLQYEFGLRREESIKIRIREAVVDDYLVLRGSWCKNGRSRRIAIISPSQWEVINACYQYVGGSRRSLIAPNRTYYQHLKHYENTLMKAGIKNAHGLRHAYAQRRYEALTGWPSPIKGGPTKQQLTPAQRITDQLARKKISSELGHQRAAILAVYCGL